MSMPIVMMMKPYQQIIPPSFNYVFYTNGVDWYKIYRINIDWTNKIKLNDDSSLYIATLNSILFN